MAPSQDDVQQELGAIVTAVQNFEFRPYEYTKLPSPTHIRIFSFIELEEPVDHPSVCGIPLIQGCLKSISLEEEPAYHALSYTWGCPFPAGHISAPEYSVNSKWPIAINGRIFYVTKNLYEALSQFKPDVEPDPDVDRTKPPYGKTRLIEAAEAGRYEDVRKFLKKGADTSRVDRFGETALHYAAENGHFDIVKLLVRAGTATDTLDSSHRTPLDCCEQRKRRKWKDVSIFLKDPQAHPHESGRVTAPTVSGKWFWIDAICINQDDITERNAQIAIMSRIYSAANSVILWLGVKDEETDLAIEAMNLIVSTDPNKDDLVFSATWRMSQAWSDQDLDEDWRSEDSVVSIRQLRALRALLRRSWFQRVWVIQEITLAEDIEMFCGPVTIRWDDFFEVVQHRLGRAHHHKALGDPRSPSTKYGRGQRGTEAWTVTDLRLRTRPNAFEQSHIQQMANSLHIEVASTWHSQLPLSVLLVFTWNFRASDARDKIFALLNIIQHPDKQSRFEADYAMSTEELFTRVARTFISVSGDDIIQDWHTGTVESLEPLEGLSFIQQPPEREKQRTIGLPSWVPDFSIPLITPRIWDTRFNACGNTKMKVHLDEHSEVLKLEGFIFDTIERLEYKPVEKTLDGPLVYHVVQWLSICSEINSEYPTGICDRSEALWRTLMLDKLWDYPPGPVADGRQSFHDFITSTLTTLTEPDSYTKALECIKQLRLTAVDGTFPTLQEVEEWRVDHAHGGKKHVCNPRFSPNRSFHSGFTQNYRNRKLFSTCKGYLGLGPRAAQEGDAIAILAGGRTAYILKRADGTEEVEKWEFVGECYVHGVMAGELADKEEYEWNTIELV